MYLPSLNSHYGLHVLAEDPKIKDFTRNGHDYKCLDVRSIINQKYQLKNGKYKDDPVFINLLAWGEIAEYVVENGCKGSQFIVLGKLKMQPYLAKNKYKSYKIKKEIVKVWPFGHPKVVKRDPSVSMDQFVPEDEMDYFNNLDEAEGFNPLAL